MTIDELDNQLNIKQQKRKKRVEEFHTTPEYKSMWQQVKQKTNQFTWQQIDADTEKKVANNILYKRIEEQRQQRDQNVKQLPYEQTSTKQETKTQKQEEKEDNKNKLPMQSVAKTQSLQEARVNTGNNNALLPQQANTTPVMYSENKDAKKIDEEEVAYQVDKIKREKEKQQNIANADGVVDKAITTVSEKLKDIAQKPKALYKGYQFGDVTKIAGGTLLGVGAHAVGSLYNAVNSLVNTGAYGVASVAGMAGAEDFSNKLKQAISEAKTETRETEQNIYNALGEKNSVLGESGNELVEQISFSKFLGALSQTSNALKGAGELRKAKAVKALADSLTFAGGADSSFEEAYSTKDIEDWQALLKGIGGGSISWLTENFNDVSGYGGTKWSKAMKEKATDAVSSAIGKTLLRLHISATSEAGEEIAEDLLGKGFNKLLNTITDLVGHGAKFETEVQLDELLTEATMAYLSTYIAEGGSTKINNTLMSNAEINQYEQDIGRKLTNEEKKIIREEIALQNELDIEKEEVIDESDLDDDQKTAVRRTMYKLNLNKSDVKELIKNVQDEAKRGTTIENKAVSESEQQITQEQPQIAQNETSEEIQQVEENQPKVEQKTQEKDILDTNQTYKNGRKQTYAKYAQDNSKYDNSSLENAKQIIPANKQGRRTKEQWLNVAKQIGTEIAEKSDTEIEEIAYRTWLDERPNNKSSLNRQGQKYVDFNSDEWINTIYNQVKDIRAQNNINTEQVLNETIPQTEAVLKERAEVPTAIQETPQLLNNETLNTEETKEEDTEAFREDMEENLFNDTPRKVRGFTESTEESKSVAWEVKKNLIKTHEDDRGSFIPISNESTINKANKLINNTSPLKQYDYLITKFDADEKPTLTDIATGELLIQHFSDIGDYDKATELTVRLAVMGTELGQMVQALSIINKSTPYARLMVAEKVVKRLADKYDTELELDPALVKKVRESKSKEATDQALNELYENVANQLPLTIGEKLDNFRHLAMLGNPKTWIRNKLGNTSNRTLFKLKNVNKGIMEDIVGKFWKDYVKDATFKRATKAQREFAHSEAVRLGGNIDDIGNKYSNKADNQILAMKRKFDSKVLSAMANKVDNILSEDDAKALMKMYESALANYMSANNLSPEDLTILNDDSHAVRNKKEENIRRATEYASNQAKEATFHQANALATWLNSIDKDSSLGAKVVGTGLKGLIPFRRTPMNIVNEGFEFSPAGILRASLGTVKDITRERAKLDKQLKKGKITKSEYNYKMSQMVNTRIDQFSKGITGTGVGSVLGYFLASIGLISAGSDDDEDEYEKKLGKQHYSLNIGNYSFSLDWLVPSAMPIFFGAELYKSLDDDAEGSFFTKSVNATAKMLNVALDTTMLSSLNSAIKYSNTADEFVSSVVTSYISQFIPSLATNIANTIDPYSRDFTSTQKGSSKDIDYTLNRFKNMLPVARGTLPIKKDAKGEDVKQDDLAQLLNETTGLPNNEAVGLLTRGIQNLLLPSNVKKVQTNEVSDELERLANTLDDSTLLKTSSDVKQEYKIDGETRRFTNEEFNEAKGIYGKTIQNALDTLIDSSGYQKLDDTDKAKKIKDVYEYAREQVKADYAKAHDLEYESSSDMYNTITAVKEAGGTEEDYFKFLTETIDMDKAEKLNYLNNMNVSNKVKEAIYANDVATYTYVSNGEDEHYNAIKAINNKVSNSYIEYKQKSAENYFTNKNEKGEDVKGQKQKRVEDFINNAKDMTTLERYYIYVQEGYANKLTSTQRNRLREALKNNRSNIDEETYNSMIKKLDKADEK